MMGISYPGFYTPAGMIDCASGAQVALRRRRPIGDWFVGDDFHHNGAFYLPHAFQLLLGLRANASRSRPASRPKPFDYKTPDGYEFYLKMGPLANVDEKYFKGKIAFWNELMEHGTYDEFWQARNIRPHLKNIKPAVMTVGGWFDAEDLFGALERTIERRAAKPRHREHAGDGPLGACAVVVRSRAIIWAT